MLRLCDFILFLVFVILLIICIYFRIETDLNTKQIKPAQEDTIQLKDGTLISFGRTKISYIKLTGEE